MAGEIAGRELIVGLKRGVAWHTPVACGAEDGLLILSDGIKMKLGSELDDSAGQQWIFQADRGEMNISGSLEAYMRYVGCDLALALIMGIAGAPSQIESTAAYSNTYSMASSIRGLFATLAMRKLSGKVWEYPSVKLHGFKLTGEMNKPLKLSLECIMDTMTRTSGTNTVASMAAVTYPDRTNRILMNKDTVFRMNDQSGGALGAGDEFAPTSFELSCSRPMDAEATAGTDGIDEPDDDGFPDISCSLKFPRYNNVNDAFFDDWNNYTSKKMDITFTGKEIESGNNYQFRIQLPHVKIIDPEASVSGPGKIPFGMGLQILGAQAAPAGMDFVEPLRIQVINTRDTDPLA